MSVFTIILALLLAGAFVGAAGWSLRRCAPPEASGWIVFSEWPWFCKGLMVPFALWVLMNVGLSFELQPFMPRIQAVRNAGGNWVPVFLRVVTGGLLIIASCWAAVSQIWLLLRVRQEVAPEWRLEFRASCLTAVLLMGLPAALVLALGGWALIGGATMLVTTVMIGYAAPVLHRPKKRPRYSRAIARIKFGNYSAAEREILRQLETNENDFDGWMLLAELHATRFHELDEAEKIILDLCLQPETTPSQIGVALNKLADWQINLAANPEAAAGTLQLICDRLPETHVAAMAAARRAQLPTNQQYYEQRHPKPIPVPELPSIMNPASHLAAGRPEQDAARAEINHLTARLTRDPDSISDREKLARLLAEPLGKVDLAIEQIELLLGSSHQPAVKRAEWLELLVNWQLHLQKDETAARRTLQKIIAELPNSPQAFTAQRRLNLLDRR